MPQTFAALGDPTRLAILTRLAAEGDMTVQEVAKPFAMSLPAISQHLNVLENAGLIIRGRDGQKRPCRICPDRLAEARQWLDHTRQAWEARFNRLERFLENAPTSSKDDIDEQ
jgi:DNA-binding transcriptional ArsR family regulator